MSERFSEEKYAHFCYVNMLLQEFCEYVVLQ